MSSVTGSRGSPPRSGPSAHALAPLVVHLVLSSCHTGCFPVSSLWDELTHPWKAPVTTCFLGAAMWVQTPSSVRSS